jgi:hypothetical protein
MSQANTVEAALAAIATARGEGVPEVPVRVDRRLDPQAALAAAQASLSDGAGAVYVVAHNSAHGTDRLLLLQGEPVTDAALGGFSFDELVDLVEACGLTVTDARATVADPLDGPASGDGVPGEVVEWVRHQPHALDRDYVVRAVAGAGVAGQRVRLYPMVPYASERRRDRFTELAGEQANHRHAALVQRDHAIGMESVVATATRRAQEYSNKSRWLNRALRQAQAEKDAAWAEARNLLAADEGHVAALGEYRETAERLQAETARLRAALRKKHTTAVSLKAELRRTKAKAKKQGAALATARRDLAGVRRSRAYRLGRALTAPARGLRRLFR